MLGGFGAETGFEKTAALVETTGEPWELVVVVPVVGTPVVGTPGNGMPVLPFGGMEGDVVGTVVVVEPLPPTVLGGFGG